MQKPVDGHRNPLNRCRNGGWCPGRGRGVGWGGARVDETTGTAARLSKCEASGCRCARHTGELSAEADPSSRRRGAVCRIGRVHNLTVRRHGHTQRRHRARDAREKLPAAMTPRLLRPRRCPSSRVGRDIHACPPTATHSVSDGHDTLCAFCSVGDWTLLTRQP